ncbi:nucleotidyltransferase substrate binding protein [Flavobacterium aquidurense]|uniref:nucleotidyltransferase substrate binding protein n=1 Tax=Flavobacterium aquidurense TaxID=362413 RepID=UPI00285ECB90|nr:nucleotidyltransferase substrate binding protein [Flavobacterium aquidurense]MDR7370430.1 nucleotidyltransferase substrate binding protein (TIGR01987 family) [Flavobacterium aquidurense]
MEDIRWEQRFSNFNKAVLKLEESVNYIKLNYLNDEDELNDENLENVVEELIKEGLIQRFEYTHELAWNVMKDYAFFQGNSTIGGSRDATREAFKLQIIENADIWMDMIQSRNKTSHTYNEEIANEIFGKIINDYFELFLNFQKTMEEKRNGEQTNLTL